MGIDRFIDNIRKRSTPFYSFLYDLFKAMQNRNISLPMPVAGFLYSERLFRQQIWYWLTNKFYYEPLLRYRCTTIGKNLKTDGDIPLIIGSGKIVIGDNVKICNRGAWFLTPMEGP